MTERGEERKRKRDRLIQRERERERERENIRLTDNDKEIFGDEQSEVENEN